MLMNQILIVLTTSSLFIISVLLLSFAFELADSANIWSNHRITKSHWSYVWSAFLWILVTITIILASSYIINLIIRGCILTIRKIFKLERGLMAAF